MSGIEPTMKLEQGDVFTRATMEYTPGALDEMALRAAEHIEGEVVQAILERMGYVRPVRCNECEHFNTYHLACHRPATVIDPDGNVYESPDDEYISMTAVDPNGYCAWGKRKEVAQ